MRGFTNAAGGSQLNLEADYIPFINTVGIEELEGKTNVDLVFQDNKIEQSLLFDTTYSRNMKYIYVNDNLIIMTWAESQYNKSGYLYACFLQKIDDNWILSGKTQLISTIAIQSLNFTLVKLTKSNKLMILWHIDEYVSSAQQYTGLNVLVCTVDKSRLSFSNIVNKVLDSNAEMLLENNLMLFELYDDIVIFSLNINSYHCLISLNITDINNIIYNNRLIYNIYFYESSTYYYKLSNNAYAIITGDKISNNSTANGDIAIYTLIYNNGNISINKKTIAIGRNYNPISLHVMYFNHFDDGYYMYFNVVYTTDSNGVYKVKINEDFSISDIVKILNSYTDEFSIYTLYPLYYNGVYMALLKGTMSKCYIYQYRNDLNFIKYDLGYYPNIDLFYIQSKIQNSDFNKLNYLTNNIYLTLSENKLNIVEYPYILYATKNKYDYSQMYNKNLISSSQSEDIYIRYNSKIKE